MKIKKRLIHLGLILMLLMAYGIGQEALAVAKTWSGGASGNWNLSGNWTPAGVPGATDDVTINTTSAVTIDGNGSTYYCKSLTIDGTAGNASLKPATTDTVTLVISGSITLTPGGNNVVFDCINSAGRCSVLINDDATLTPAADYGATDGIRFYNLTIQDASVSYAGDFAIRVDGNYNLTGTSAFTPAANTDGTLILNGTTVSTQTFNVAATAYCELVNLTLAGNATVTTAKSITLNELLTVGAGSTFRATRDTIYLKPNAAAMVTPANSGTLEFYDLFLNCGAAVGLAPATDYTVKGHLIKVGSGNYAATAGTVTFTNTTEKQIIKSGSGTLELYNITVSNDSKVQTYSDFNIDNNITISGTGEFKALGGTITKPFTEATDDAVSVSTTGYLELFNLTLAAVAQTLTCDDITITGNLTVPAGPTFTMNAGKTITFDNISQRTITNGTAANMNLANVTVTDGSKVTTASSFDIDDQGTASTFLVEGTGEFKATAGTINFTGTAAKTITKEDGATLEFFNVTVADAVHSVTTASSFVVKGTDFDLLGAANGTFTATAGTIQFDAAVDLVAPSADRMTFYNIKINNMAATIAAGDFVVIKGNLVIDGVAGTLTPAVDATVTFSGTVQQYITGTSTAATPVSFGTLVINKAAGTVPADNVTMELNVAFQNTGDLTLTDGYLDLGTKTLTLNGVTVTSATGAIDGNTGTVLLTGNACTWTLGNALFTPDVPAGSDPTLYNLTVNIADATDADLTVNNDLTLGAALTYTTDVLTVYGDITYTTGTLTHGGSGTLVLAGTGQVNSFSNSLFTASLVYNLTLKRAEALAGNLRIDGTFILNTGVQYFNLGIYSLDIRGAISLESGSMTANAATVLLDNNTTITTIPANLFKDNNVKNLTLRNNVDYTLGGDLYVGTALTQATAGDINTNGNVLTLGNGCTIPTYDGTDHIIGTLKRTVTSAATVFPVGGGVDDDYRPLTLQFKNAGSEMDFTVTSYKSNPTTGKGGDPSRAVQAMWTVSSTDTAPIDTVKATFGWGDNHNNGLAADFADNKLFPAVWRDSYWRDYRNTTVAGAYTAPGNPDRQLAMAAPEVFEVLPDSVAGDWAVFAATAATDVAKNDAISVSKNKVAITAVTPTTSYSGFPFTVTVELQDQYGNPIVVATGDGPQTISVTSNLGSAIDAPTTRTGVIPVGSSSVTLTGLSITAAAGSTGTQLIASNTTTTTYQKGISDPINIIADLPANQAESITLATGSYPNTSITLGVTVTGGGNCIVVARAESAIADYPVDGSTYVANTIFGGGSIIGDGAVVYKGATGSGVLVTGLAPNTTYHFRAFAYSGTAGNERYMSFPAAGNPKSFTTSGTGTDDDVIFGTNDTWATAKAIGTNSRIQGTIKSASDVDWFSFMITNAAPNIRASLTNLPGNYNIEIYDQNQRRIRRGIKISSDDEGPVINNLPPGTYTVKISGVNSAYDTTDTYILEVTTKGAEIYSVTP